MGGARVWVQYRSVEAYVVPTWEPLKVLQPRSSLVMVVFLSV